MTLGAGKADASARLCVQRCAVFVAGVGQEPHEGFPLFRAGLRLWFFAGKREAAELDAVAVQADRLEAEGDS